MSKPTIITGLRIVAAYDKGYGMQEITTDKDGVNEKHEVHCTGVDGWQGGCDDTVTMIIKDGVKYIEPAQWQEEVPVEQKVEEAVARREAHAQRKAEHEEKIAAREALAKEQNDADIKRQKAEQKKAKIP